MRIEPKRVRDSVTVGYHALQANPASELILPRKEAQLPEQALALSQVDEALNQPDVSDALGIHDRAMTELLEVVATSRNYSVTPP